MKRNSVILVLLLVVLAGFLRQPHNSELEGIWIPKDLSTSQGFMLLAGGSGVVIWREPLGVPPKKTGPLIHWTGTDSKLGVSFATAKDVYGPPQSTEYTLKSDTLTIGPLGILPGGEYERYVPNRKRAN